VGTGPLLFIIVAAALGLWPDPNPNPIGPGLLFFFTLWPAVICIIIGVIRVRNSQRPARGLTARSTGPLAGGGADAPSARGRSAWFVGRPLPRHIMPTLRRSRSSARLATQAFELSVAAPQVIALRLTRLAFVGLSPSARDRRELLRMCAEKVATFYESWNAMYLALLRANLNLALSPFQVWWSPMRSQRTRLAILGHGLAPIRRRAVANARRLRRTRIV